MENVQNNETKKYFTNYLLKKGKVYRRLDGGHSAWAVPKSARFQICRLCHDDAGHLALEKTLLRIRENYWFADMSAFVRKYVNACLNCAYYKRNAGKKQGKLHPIEKTPIPFHTIHIDHVEPFESSNKKNKYILVIVDAFTKFTIIEPVKDTKTKRAIKILLNVIHLFGVPHWIISDRGMAFTARSFTIFCSTYGFKHVLNAVATPRANGQCERYNRTIVASLAATVAERDHRTWDEFVKQI